MYLLNRSVLSAADSAPTAVIKAMFVDNNIDFVLDSATTAAFRFPLTIPRGFPRIIALFKIV